MAVIPVDCCLVFSECWHQSWLVHGWLAGGGVNRMTVAGSAERPGVERTFWRFQ